MKRASFQDMPCPIARTLDVLGERWALLVVREAFKGAKHFKEFEERLGVAPNILAARLKLLVDAGVLDVDGRDQAGRALAYGLTDAGLRLFPTLITVALWGLQHRFGDGEAPLEVVDRVSGHRITGVCYTTEDGTVVPAKQVTFRPK